MNTVNEYEIFKPLVGKVSIATWDLASLQDMAPVVENIAPVESKILVGYSKQTHSMGKLINISREYETLGFAIRWLPSCHIKVWLTPICGWVGSCNFTRSTIINYMHRIKLEKAAYIFNAYWEEAHVLRRGTDLTLLPQTQKRIYFKR